MGGHSTLASHFLGFFLAGSVGHALVPLLVPPVPLGA